MQLISIQIYYLEKGYFSNHIHFYLDSGELVNYLYERSFTLTSSQFNFSLI